MIIDRPEKPSKGGGGGERWDGNRTEFGFKRYWWPWTVTAGAAEQNLLGAGEAGKE